MRIVCFCVLVMICFSWPSETVAGNCNLIVSNNLGDVSLGDIDLKCNEYSDVDIKEIKAKVAEYKLNIAKINNLYKDVMIVNKDLKEKQDKTESNVTLHEQQLIKLRFSQNLAEENFQNLWSEHERLRTVVAKTYTALLDEVENHRNMLELELEQKITTESSKLFQKIDIALRQNEKRIQTFEQRVVKLENDNIFLMNEWRNGNLRDSVGFFSGSAGAWHSKQNWVPKFSVEYERLIPRLETAYFKDMNISFFGEIAWLKWTDSLKLATLPGFPESELKTDYNMVNLSVGTRVFVLNWGNNLNNYVLLSGGHSVAGSEDTFSYAVGTGIEYTRKSTRASLEIRWDGFSSIEQTNASFNTFGNARIDRRRERQGGLLLVVRLAFR